MKETDAVMRLLVVAVTVAVPAEMPVTTPSVLTERIVPLELDHVTAGSASAG